MLFVKHGIIFLSQLYLNMLKLFADFCHLSVALWLLILTVITIEGIFPWIPMKKNPLDLESFGNYKVYNRVTRNIYADRHNCNYKYSIIFSPGQCDELGCNETYLKIITTYPRDLRVHMHTSIDIESFYHAASNHNILDNYQTVRILWLKHLYRHRCMTKLVYLSYHETLNPRTLCHRQQMSSQYKSITGDHFRNEINLTRTL